MPRPKVILLYVAIFLGALLVFTASDSSPPDDWRTVDEFTAHLDDDRVVEFIEYDNALGVVLEDGTEYSVDVMVTEEWERYARSRGIVMEQSDGTLDILAVVFGVAVVLLLVVLALRFWQRRTGGLGGFSEMRKSRARVLPESVHTTFNRVAGADEAKERLGDVVACLRDPDRWRAAGVRMPRGVLLEGPPGCGKTLLARAVAGEASVPFFYVSGSEFVEMLVGVGAARVRDMFEEAEKQAPAVIFIDEIDAIGRRRGSGVGASHEEREQTLNQLLVCLDGIEKRAEIVVLAATNRADILDPALLRPGRFDTHLKVPPLNEAARAAALGIHLRTRSLDPAVSIEWLAAHTDGWTGAELENLCNEATLTAARRALAKSPPAPVSLTRDDFDRPLKARAERTADFDRLDAALVASASQLVQPDHPLPVVVSLVSDAPDVRGSLVWVDAAFVKIDRPQGACVIPKVQVQTISADAPLAAADPGAAADHWAGKQPELAK